MSEIRPTMESPIDRREETVVTNQPGYQATEQVVRDVAAERRLGLYQVTRIIWTILGILEILFGLRFVLKLIAANPDSGFAQFIYGITAPFLAPFAGLTATPSASGVVLEVPTLIAMAVYALFFWIVVRVVQLATDRPSARVVTRSIHEQTPTRVVTTEPTATTGTTETERTTRVISNR